MRAKIFSALAIVGAVYSLYLFYLEHFVGVCFTGYCSEYPALLGFLWFASTPFTLKSKIIKKLWQVSGVFGICYLVFTEFSRHFFCPFCTVAHVLGLALIGLSFIINFNYFG